MNPAVQVGVAAGAAALAAHWVPSTVSLGQWAGLAHLPGGWCTWRGQRASRAVAFTFDDGPDPERTPTLLERLDDLGWRATFFCLGERVRAHPDVVREVLLAGHQVETHGYRHHHHLWRSPGWVAGDLDAALDAMHDIRVHPHWFRPPYGQASGSTLWHAHRRGLRPVLWSVWGREWAIPTAEGVARRVAAGLSSGAVVLLHDSDAFSPPGSAQRAFDALDGIADEMDRRGLAAVTLDELVAA
ncbi:MAG: polysaccharide deacetylase family protein [Acidimicrobiaceae bacterium]|nr:polysaccharide deacetylase family protein [Acidimicrobiaceae bacterium]